MKPLNLLALDILPSWFSFKNLIKWLYDALLYCAGLIGDIFLYCFKLVYEFFRDLVWSIIGPLYETVKTAVGNLVAILDQMWNAVGGIHPYFDFANAWVPVDFFIQCVVAYLGLWLALVVYRTIKSWIPTVSGGG